MEKQPKSIRFVSWKKHKLDQALTQIDGVYENYGDETIVDFFREKFGYPQALPVYDIIKVDPIIPKSPYDLALKPTELPRRQKCPVCLEEFDSARFTYHLSGKCFTDCKNRNEIISKYFEKQNSMNAQPEQNS